MPRQVFWLLVFIFLMLTMPVVVPAGAFFVMDLYGFPLLQNSLYGEGDYLAHFWELQEAFGFVLLFSAVPNFFVFFVFYFIFRRRFRSEQALPPEFCSSFAGLLIAEFFVLSFIVVGIASWRAPDVAAPLALILSLLVFPAVGIAVGYAIGWLYGKFVASRIVLGQTGDR